MYMYVRSVSTLFGAAADSKLKKMKLAIEELSSRYCRLSCVGESILSIVCTHIVYSLTLPTVG